MAQLLFLLVIAAIPIQLGKFFFFDFSYVLGLPIDYRAVTIYASDIIVLLFIIFSIWENRKKLKQIPLDFKDYCLVLVIFNLHLFISTPLFSVSPISSLVFNLKILIFSLASVFAANLLQNKKVAQNSLKVLIFSVFWQSLLILGQFIKQGSLGLQIIGERTFDSSTVLIAHSQAFGRQFLRPYGTFPHPNIAAAYLAFSLIILAPFLKKATNPLKVAFTIVSFLAIAITYSKSAIFVLGLSLPFTTQNFRKLLALTAVAIFLAIWIFLQTSMYQVASIAERLLLSQAALDITLKNPLFGVGSNNFILELSKLNLSSLSQTRLLQPVHNVFLLILAQNGIIGLLIFTTLLLTVSKNLKGKTKTVIFIGMLVYLSIDHFLWTLQQGQLMFWFLMSYFLADAKKA